MVNFPTSAFVKARLQHWLERESSPYDPSSTLAYRRDPSPDGTAEGQYTWLDHAGKSQRYYTGTQILPKTVAWRLPDGTTRYSQFSRNGWGKITSQTSTYTQSGGGIGTRTRTITYGSDGIDPTHLYNYDSQLVRLYGYSSRNQLTGVVEYPNALHLYSTSYTYAAFRYTADDTVNGPKILDLTWKRDRTGLVTEYRYDGLRRLISLTDPRQNTTTYTYCGCGSPESITDPLNHTTYDGLSRLRRSVQSYWTSTGGTNGYWAVNGDTRRLYDGMRVVQERNASNVPTVAYTRGLDLSDTLDGAGGIGGLLARSHGYSGGTWSTHSFYHADGGGNITMLIYQRRLAMPRGMALDNTSG